KDHSLPGNSLDASNTLGFIFMGNWPLKGMYMPDAIAHYSVGGVNYVVTANEGDARDYSGFSEEIRAGNAGLPLDNAAFSDVDYLKSNNNLGRINSTIGTGDLNDDGLFEEIHVYGARSFSIWNMDTQTMVYDSGDLMERITAADPVFGSLFNASNSNNTFKNRSDDKGPEPEGVIIKEINGAYYAFIALERIGGIMTFNITDPNNPVFENYSNSRDTNTFAGDHGAETLIYIAPEDNSNNTGLIVVANEVSSTLSFFSIDNNTLSTPNFTASTPFKLFPNPVNSGGVIQFTTEASGVVYDLNGRSILSFTHSDSLALPQLKPGIYLVKTENGTTQKLIVR
ncbi:MAG: T9SS type A sorting domain-containing protein, partial [Flavobacteriaceae bacterium]|nr:T9SS type A sorting domain-containing protein [Flavobacteriaceae bacterium]